MRIFSRCIYTNTTAGLNQIIKEHICQGKLDNARYIFDQNPATRNITSWNMLISGHVKHGQLQCARKLFDEMPQRDIVSYNAILSGLSKVQNHKKINDCYILMGKEGLRPNEVTFSISISSVLKTAFNSLIPQLHCHVIVLGLSSNTFVGSSLIKGYADLIDFVSLRNAFDDVSVKDASSWNALISGFMDMQLTSEARRAFDMMPEKNNITWSILVNGYIRNKKLDEARFAFNENKSKCIVLWTTMLSGYVQNGIFLQALELFLEMLRFGTRPNHFTYSSALDACAGCSYLIIGKQIHSSILKSGTYLDVILLTSLVDMYAKCGEIETSFHIFESMPNKNLVTWNTIIGGYAVHGLASRALQEFEKMSNIGFNPDETTFVNLLAACAHGGLVEKGESIFTSMVKKYMIEPELEHYACMVDMYGKKGYLEKAVAFIEEMPIEPDVVVWGALVSACGLHTDLGFSEFAKRGISRLEKDHPALYSMLAKIYSEKGRWSNVFELKKMMKERWAKKQKAGSWINAPIQG